MLILKTSAEGVLQFSSIGVRGFGRMAKNPNLQPGIYPGGEQLALQVAVSIISSKMSEEKQQN